MAEGPSKSDIEAVFKRLRAIPTNKTCFDCGAKNPTWSSVTFGVFICIDCSSVHRNLGVHLTFVRSTQLDTQWTWLQIRNMQLGGNANAHAFFRQHNCSTTDAQQKYTSRAAILYKEKLANMSQQYQRIHGTQLHIDGHGHGHENQVEKKEEDFFGQHEAFPDTNPNSNGVLSFKAPVPEPVKVAPATQPTGPTPGPNVDTITAPSENSEPKVAKSLIGQRKPAAKKPGLGAKKGLGATKVHTNFEEIEREAQMADALRAQKPVEVKPEEAEQKAASLSLAFQELAMQTKKQSEIMQKVDPKNAEQVERIGMGILANKSGHRPVISHSIVSDMTMISQDSSTITKSNASVLASLERSKYSGDETPSSFYSKNSGLDDLLSRDSSSKSSRDSEWDMLTDFTPAPKSTSSSSFGGLSSAPSSSAYGSPSSSSSKTSSTKYGSSSKDTGAFADSGEAVKKFANAKAISSDQFFQDSGSGDYERRTNLSRFEGSSGISSADYFGTGSTSGRSRNAGPSLNIQAPDLDDVKESVRQGVTKVASKLSNLANDFASSIQDRYGY